MTEKPNLDISSLEKAVQTLSIALDSYHLKKETLGSDDRDIMRDGVIQRFEYTFELSWKMMRRFFEMYGLERVDTATNREFFRKCFEQGLIRDPTAWFAYLNDRNQTSHIYDQTIARDVFASAEAFLDDARFLIAQLNERIR